MSLRTKLHAKMAQTPLVAIKNERGASMQFRPPGNPQEYRTRNNIIPRGKRSWRWRDGKQVPK